MSISSDMLRRLDKVEIQLVVCEGCGFFARILSEQKPRCPRCHKYDWFVLDTATLLKEVMGIE